MKSNWNKEEDKFLIQNYEDLTNKQISNILKKTTQAIRNRAFNLKLIKYKDLVPGTKYNKLFLHLKKNAQLRNLECSLTQDEHKNIIKQNCYYCGIEPKNHNIYLNSKNEIIKNNKRTPLKQKTVDRAWIKINTVDRIDSSKGYNIENCVPSCWFCNKMKNNYHLTDFLNQINKIIKYQKGKNEQ